LIPLLDHAIERASEHGIEDVVIGMSHRGRLNVMANLLDFPPSNIFRRFEEFEAASDPIRIGDVPFHLGMETTRRTAAGRTMRLSLCFNPSHLEFVGPVVLGRARARLDRGRTDEGPINVLPLIVHGDAAFAGQGIVQELLNLSRLPGYATGGTVHVVLNNQIGFTTQPEHGRSTQYASDVARMLQIPVFHVNGEHPEAVDRVIRLALDFRTHWRRDVVVDMYCFRRHGHMEQDDPTFTQPILYQAIARQAPLRETYTANLVKLGQVTGAEAEAIAVQSRRSLEHELARVTAAKTPDAVPSPTLPEDTAGEPMDEPDTALPRAQLISLLQRLSVLPEGFETHPKIGALLRRRRAMAQGKSRLDWATGETLAYASLLASGRTVRLTGEDSERGTFGHRHAVLHDQRSAATWTPLATLSPDQGRCAFHNSPLSETGVLAFEFGYSLEEPDGLIIWEAQFGDFANVAQVIIDQFIVSSTVKWRQSSGLCLFLPHGLEGQGPEHSSARPERFLQLAACDNVDIVHLTTASQVFHRLRLQALRKPRRPLIAFTPKRLLQHAAASSPLDEFCDARFRPVLADVESGTVQHILLCCGQIFADLERERQKQKEPAIAIVRMEQLYPFPETGLARALARYPAGTTLTWVQEEPENMGPWRWLRPQLEELLGDRYLLRWAARPEQPSPAVGSQALHQQQQQQLLRDAFAR
jgi:2-oxoglutarate dehydrogenase E1 component